MFFGADIERTGAGVLHKSADEGYQLLACDAPAVVAARRHQVPHLMIDEYIGLDELIEIRRQALQFERSWFGCVGEQFCSDGVCWPEFDGYALYGFWREVLLTIKLGEHFVNNGGECIKFFRNSILRPSLYYYRSDIHAAILEGMLSGKCEPVVIKVTGQDREQYNLLTTHGITFQLPDGRIHPAYKHLEDRVVLALNQNEFTRFGPVIESLKGTFGENVAAVTLLSSPELIEPLSHKYGIAVFCPLRSEGINRADQERFCSAYDNLVRELEGTAIVKVIKCLRYHFEYYCSSRWPVLAGNIRSWGDLWNSHRPRAVVTSALSDGESQLPAEAAGRTGIKAFSVPHSAGCAITLNNSSEYMLYSFPAQKLSLQRIAKQSGKFKRSRNLVAVNEHPVSCSESVFSGSRGRILVLTDPVFMNGWLSTHIEPSGQKKALQILNEPPLDMRDEIEVKIKTHPGYSEHELLGSLCADAADKILPAKTELSAIASQADLIVAANYGGAALTHVLRLNKPVVFLWTERLLSQTDAFDIRYGLEFILPAGVVVHTAEEFWRTVKRFFADAQFNKELCDTASAFRRSYLDDSNYPDIGEVIAEVLLQERENSAGVCKPAQSFQGPPGRSNGKISPGSGTCVKEVNSLKTIESLGEFIAEDGQTYPRIKGVREAICPNWQLALNPQRGGTRFSIDRKQIEEKKREVLRAERFLRTHGLTLEGKDVLEVGCHAGIQTYLLAELGARSVHGIDIPEYGVRQACDLEVEGSDLELQSNRLAQTREDVSRVFSPEAVSKVCFDDLNIEELDITDRYDAILSWKTLEHIEHPGQAFRRMFAALRPGGFCFHEYNPFFCFNGGHTLCTLDFLYGHCRLGARDFKRYIKQFRSEEERIAIEFYEHNLNRMTLADLKEYVSSAGFATISIVPWMEMGDLEKFDGRVLNQVRAHYPSVTEKDLLAGYVWVLLRKPVELRGRVV
jgi:SAM-dependent methyltransferase